MGKLVIDGGNKISGEIGVQGAKNAVLQIWCLKDWAAEYIGQAIP